MDKNEELLPVLCGYHCPDSLHEDNDAHFLTLLFKRCSFIGAWGNYVPYTVMLEYIWKSEDNLWRLIFFLLPCGTWGWNTNPQTWPQVSLPLSQLTSHRFIQHIKDHLVMSPRSLRLVLLLW